MSTSPMITANLMVPQVLSNWAQQNLGRTLATADEWCFIANNSIPSSAGSCGGANGLTFLGYDGEQALLIACGMSPDGSNRNNLPQITADQFVSALLAVQQQAASSAQGPGGSSQGGGTAPGTSTGGGGPASGTGATKQGVLGLTNCSFCQTVAKNPLLLLIIVVAIYFLFFDD